MALMMRAILELSDMRYMDGAFDESAIDKKPISYLYTVVGFSPN
jgi:hypothetical protein